jgi:SAM-dependent methyltransferase
MSAPQVQLDWDVTALHGAWPTGLDNRYLLGRLHDVPVDATAAGASGRVLEVAASEAIHSCRLNLRGLSAFSLEPSPAMLARARVRMAEYGATVTLIRGIAERLPFRDQSFDRVLCESAIDHLADPGLGIREMARVLKPEGRLVIGVVNYGSLNVRLSRVVYRVARRLRLASRERHLFWDSPVPIEHTFECTYPILMRLGRQHLDLERAFGVSIGWAFPRWGAVHGPLPEDVAMRLLRGLDRIAYRVPRIADYILSVWKQKSSS